MRRWLFRAGLVAAGVCGLGAAQSASAETVLARHSAWNASRTRIYTDLLIQADDGSWKMKRVPGGEVGDVGMVVFELRPPGAPPSDAEKYGVEFVRSRSGETGALLRWEKSCVFLTPDAAGSSDIAGDGELAIIQAVADHWMGATQSCSYLNFIIDTPAPAETIFDKQNVIKFREDRWGRPASGNDPEECYSAQAAALTTVFYVNAAGSPNDGLIRDADVEINAVDYAVAACSAPGVCETSGQGSVSDLANTLTHELGHLVGLDHTCWDQPGVPPTDDQGLPVPSCGVGVLPPEITDATMYNYQDPGEVKKATVEQDDVDGWCAVYPAANDPGTCIREGETVDDGGMCAVAAGRAPGAGGAAGWWLVAGVVSLAAASSRRGSRRTRG
jgi:hypothetical protein